MTSFVGDLDLSKVHLTPMVMDSQGRKKVEIFLDNTSTKNNNRLQFQLCPDEDEPLVTKYGLDIVRDNDRDPTRRGLMCIVENESTISSLKNLDEAVVKYAIENSKDLFKKTLNEEQVRMRYKPVIAHEKDDDTLPYLMKFKVKCTGAQVPTKIFCKTERGTTVRSNEDALANRGSRVMPIVSAYGLWFMAGDMQFGLSFQAENILVEPADGPSETSVFKTKRPLVLEEEENVEAKQPKIELEEADEGESAM